MRDPDPSRREASARRAGGEYLIAGGNLYVEPVQYSDACQAPPMHSITVRPD